MHLLCNKESFHSIKKKKSDFELSERFIDPAEYGCPLPLFSVYYRNDPLSVAKAPCNNQKLVPRIAWPLVSIPFSFRVDLRDLQEQNFRLVGENRENIGELLSKDWKSSVLFSYFY